MPSAAERGRSILELRRDGLTLERIADRVGISRQAVTRLLRQEKERISQASDIPADLWYDVRRRRLEHAAEKIYPRRRAETETAWLRRILPRLSPRDMVSWRGCGRHTWGYVVELSDALQLQGRAPLTRAQWEALE